MFAGYPEARSAEEEEIQQLFALVAKRTNLDGLCFQLRRSPAEVRARVTILAVACVNHAQRPVTEELETADLVAV